MENIVAKPKQTNSNRKTSVTDMLIDPPDNNKVTIIKSKGGDVATKGGKIDKRSGGIYINEKSEPSVNWGRRKSVLLGVVGLVLATVLGILSNIVATYIQENFGLINDSGRFAVVFSIFIIILAASIVIVIQNIRHQSVE